MADGVYAEETEFKGYPIIEIYTGHEYNGNKEYVSMGVRKAAAVCDMIDSIRRFVEKHQASKQGGKRNGRQGY